MPTVAHTAAAAGNTGVEVVATTQLILFFEEASHLAVKGFYEPGEVTVGTKVDVEHLAPAHIGIPLVATAEFLAMQGRRIDFACEDQALAGCACGYAVLSVAIASTYRAGSSRR